jgi:hypothetical protein
MHVTIQATPGTDGRLVARDFVDEVYPLLRDRFDRDDRQRRNR